MKRLTAIWTLIATFLVSAALFAAPAVGAPKSSTGYQYRWNGYTVTATYTCNDGTIVPGPIPKAIVQSNGKRGMTAAITAHGVEKLDVAMRANFGVPLIDSAKGYLYTMLPTVTC